MAVSAPWAGRTPSGGKLPSCSSLGRTVPRLCCCRRGGGFLWLCKGVSIRAGPLSPFYVLRSQRVQVFSFPCKGYVGSHESRPQMGVVLSPLSRGAQSELSFHVCAVCPELGGGSKGQHGPAAACWALVAGRPRAGCISGIFLLCPRKRTQVTCSHAHDLLHFRV